jgi:hypothetical protein
MGFWAEIKMALNSTLGKDLKPLDVIIKQSQHELYYSQLEKDVINGADNIYLYPRGTKIIEDESLSQEVKIIGIPVGAEEISSNTFNENSFIVSVLLPVGIKTIGNTAFGRCDKLSTINIPDGVKYIGTGAFSESPVIKNIKIPSGVSEIGSSTFLGCTGLQNVIIGNEIKYIPSSFCRDCSNLESVTVGNAIETIYGGAFANCPKLSKIIYRGTMAQWRNISKYDGWISQKTYSVYCTDGTISVRPK